MKSIQKTARFAGILYLVITVAAIIAHIYVPSIIIVPGDAAATANNIMESETLFRVGVVGGELVILLKRNCVVSCSLCLTQICEQNTFFTRCSFKVGDDHHTWDQFDQLLLCHAAG